MRTEIVHFFPPLDCAVILFDEEGPPFEEDRRLRGWQSHGDAMDPAEFLGILIADKAEVLYYRLTPGAANLLKRVSSLYRWRHPYLPEDLCFMRRTGEPLFTSIAHERDAYFTLSDEELQTLLAELPEIAEILSKDEVEE